MITSRVLPRPEWGEKLAGTELADAWIHLPYDAVVIVGEDALGVAWTWAVVKYHHLEGAWIRPDLRKGRAAAQAYREVMGMLDASVPRVPAVLTCAITDDVKRLIYHVGGVQLPGEHYVIPVHRRGGL